MKVKAYNLRDSVPTKHSKWALRRIAPIVYAHPYCVANSFAAMSVYAKESARAYLLRNLNAPHIGLVTLM